MMDVRYAVKEKLEMWQLVGVTTVAIVAIITTLPQRVAIWTLVMTAFFSGIAAGWTWRREATSMEVDV